MSNNAKPFTADEVEAEAWFGGQKVRILATITYGQKAQRCVEALRGILEIGKRDTTNPKYDAYFDEAREALAALTDARTAP